MTLHPNSTAQISLCMKKIITNFFPVYSLKIDEVGYSLDLVLTLRERWKKVRNFLEGTLFKKIAVLWLKIILY